MQLIEIREIKGKIVTKTGLHIGAGDTEMHIGGTDNTVIRNPLTQEPYIPGSSIKGKVRALLEMESGLMGLTKGSPIQPKDLKGIKDGEQRAKAEKILKIFGSAGSEGEEIAELNLGPSRASFSDCFLNKDWKKKAEESGWSYFEVKSENTINRIKGTAYNLRQMERVVAGAEFDFTISMKLLGEDEEELFEYLLAGLKILEKDALGGSSSRGYGRIEFRFEDEKLQEKFEKLNPFKERGER